MVIQKSLLTIIFLIIFCSVAINEILTSDTILTPSQLPVFPSSQLSSAASHTDKLFRWFYIWLILGMVLLCIAVFLYTRAKIRIKTYTTTVYDQISQKIMELLYPLSIILACFAIIYIIITKLLLWLIIAQQSEQIFDSNEQQPEPIFDSNEQQPQIHPIYQQPQQIFNNIEQQPQIHPIYQQPEPISDSLSGDQSERKTNFRKLLRELKKHKNETISPYQQRPLIDKLERLKDRNEQIQTSIKNMENITMKVEQSLAKKQAEKEAQKPEPKPEPILDSIEPQQQQQPQTQQPIFDSIEPQHQHQQPQPQIFDSIKIGLIHLSLNNNEHTSISFLNFCGLIITSIVNGQIATNIREKKKVDVQNPNMRTLNYRKEFLQRFLYIWTKPYQIVVNQNFNNLYVLLNVYMQIWSRIHTMESFYIAIGSIFAAHSVKISIFSRISSKSYNLFQYVHKYKNTDIIEGFYNPYLFQDLFDYYVRKSSNKAHLVYTNDFKRFCQFLETVWSLNEDRIKIVHRILDNMLVSITL